MTSSWNTANPIDHTLNSSWPEEVRNLKDLLKSRLILQDAEPATRPGGAAFEANDNGSIWIDSDATPDNLMYILTDYSGPTWTLMSVSIIEELLAASREFLAADATLTLTNTDEEDTDGGRQSRFIAKGEQSGGEVTTLGYIEFSHEGTDDDQKGQLKILINDGDDDDAPSKQAIGFQSTGKIDVPNSLSVLDEDDMVSDDAEVLVTQQSLVAYITGLLNTDIAVAKGWVHFDGANADPNSTKVGYNVSSITDNGVGAYTVNWTVPFASASYAVSILAGGIHYWVNSQTANSVQIVTKDISVNPLDMSNISVIAFGTQ